MPVASCPVGRPMRVLLALAIGRSGALQLRTELDATANACSLAEDAASEILAGGHHRHCQSYGAMAAGAPGMDYVSFGRRHASKEGPGEQLTVWVSGYPRSGSSTILSMVSSTVDDNRAGGHTFSIFEPCHDGDEYLPWKANEGCKSVLWGLSRCDFTGVVNLWGWADPHSSNNRSKFSADVASRLCSEADIIAFKTVDYGHMLSSWTWLMDSRPKFRVLDVVRDPRGIYASWKALEPFATLVKNGEFYTIEGICEHFVQNMDLKDPRVHRVVFEDLAEDPVAVTRKAYDFLGEPFGDKQLEWVNNTFHAKECPPPAPGMEGFTDCHTESGKAVAEKWRTTLTTEELAAFSNSAACRRVAKAYGYPIS